MENAVLTDKIALLHNGHVGQYVDSQQEDYQGNVPTNDSIADESPRVGS